MSLCLLLKLRRLWHTPEDYVWWLVAPLIIFLITWGPEWWWNLLYPLRSWVWWRVPIIPAGVFDTHVYIHWLAAAVQGQSYGGHLHWLAVPYGWLWRLINSWASLPELWLITRWFSCVLTLWIGAWTVRQWSECSVRASRGWSLMLWLGIVAVLGMRPGAYSWYLPFCLLALGGTVVVEKMLLYKNYWLAIGWTLIVAVTAYVYPWFFLLCGMLLAVTWSRWLIIKCGRWWLISGLSLIVVSTIMVSVPLAREFLSPELAALVGMYERNGVTFMHLPFFANTVLAFGLWLGLAWILKRALPPELGQRLWISWITLTMLWFHPVWTGLFLYPDHFIGPTVVLSWLSAALIITQLLQQNLTSRLPKFGRWLIMISAGVALAVVVYIVQQPARLHPWKFDPYIVHVFHWSMLAVTLSVMTWLSSHHVNTCRRWLIGICLIYMAGLASWGTLSVVVRNRQALINDAQMLPAASWLSDNIQSNVQGCAAPGRATWFAAHSGRRVFPAEPLFSYPVSSEYILHDLETYASIYAVTTTHQEMTLKFMTDLYRSLPCEEGTKYSHGGVYGRILRWFGVTPERVPDLLGCRQAVIDNNWTRISQAFLTPRALSASDIKKTCGWLVIADSDRDNWRLPKQYRQLWREGEWAVYGK